jgi:tRNA(adenine34) deaminase
MHASDHERLVRLAMVQAEVAAARGDAPFGAVLANGDGSVLLTEANAQATIGDPTAHAEIRLIRRAAAELGRPTLEGLVVASNAEPCSMCSSALVKARVAVVVFGAPHEPHMDPPIGLAEIAARSSHRVVVIGPVLGPECAAAIARARDETAAPD